MCTVGILFRNCLKTPFVSLIVLNGLNKRTFWNILLMLLEQLLLVGTYQSRIELTGRDTIATIKGLKNKQRNKVAW